jgi:hypothetical protein
MAKYNPFAEKAGMRRIAEQQPTEGVLRISETQTLAYSFPLLTDFLPIIVPTPLRAKPLSLSN